RGCAGCKLNPIPIPTREGRDQPRERHASPSPQSPNSHARRPIPPLTQSNPPAAEAALC
uniref:Uncharacterized protein n=1 Tax=Aegilops tauschii subsp. strangulata TaxID=200361 RepID=A0A453L021_AEGTS